MIRLARIRPPEWQIGTSAVALLVALYLTPWFRVSRALPPGRTIVTGWEGLSILGPVALAAGVLGLAIWWLQATRRAPAMPASATVVELFLSLALTIGLLVRVLISLPAPGALVAPLALIHTVEHVDVRYGGYLGLALAVLLLAGCYLSLRTDGIAAADGPGEIELVQLPEPTGIGSPAADS